MFFLQMPARNDLPSYTERITISGALYSMRFTYNTREQRWVMDIADANENDVVTGLPVRIKRDITGQYVAIVGLPPGIFFASDDANPTAAKGTQPTRYSFGTDHTLWYGDPTIADP